MKHRQCAQQLIRSVVLAALAVSAAACVTEIAAPPVQPAQPVNARVEFYPAHGQTPDQQARDKFECNDWAVKHSGFDPSVPGVPPHLRIAATPVIPPAGSGAAVGAATGAVFGAAVSRPWESGRGALLGAMAGLIVGGIADAERLEQARAAAATGADTTNERAAMLEQMASNYRRAMSACLEGRGYTVR